MVHKILKSVYLKQLKSRKQLTTNLLRLSCLTVTQTVTLLHTLERIEQAEKDIKVDEGVQWTLHGAEDILCTQYDGEVWSLNEVHPKPVQDTHPYCKCTLERVEIVEEFPF